jgi:6-pyruvoyl-tetrahydropterin synthase
MEPVNFDDVKASKKVKNLIAELQHRLLQTEDALEDITRAAEIAEVTGQIEMMSTFVQQSNELLRNRIVRPDSSIAADNYKMTIVTDDDVPENNKNVT